MSRLFVVSVWALPGVSRLQNFVRDVGAHYGDVNAEDRIWLRRDVCQSAVQRRSDHRAGVRDLHPMSFAVRPARPAGVDQPAMGMVFGNALAQQFGVNAGVVNHERGAEACGESRLRLLAQTFFGASNLCGVAGYEMIHRLLWSQL